MTEVEQLQARIKELESAERTLINLGYENKGGELWKPPVGKAPNFSLIDRLNKRIEDLELEVKKHFKAGRDYFNKLKETENQCNEFAHKIKELESEKYNAYQEGKLSVVNRLLDLNPENAIDALSELTITTRTGEEYEESWDSKKLLEYFDVDQNFQSKVTELEDRCEAMYWSAIAIREGLSDDIFFEGDKNLRQFIQSRINEIKAQGIEEAIQALCNDCGSLSDVDNDVLYDFIDKLRTNHE